MADESATEPVQAESNDPQLETIAVDEGMYPIVMGVGMLLYGIFALLGIMTWGVIMFTFGDLKFNLGFWFFIAIALHIFLSLWDREVSTDEHAFLYFFGSPIRRIKKAGLVFTLWGAVSLDRLPADQREIHMPTTRSKIFWGDDDQPVPAGMERAIRVTTKAPSNLEKSPLDAQLSVGLAFFVFWTVTDPLQFRAHCRTIGEGDSMLRALAMRSLNEIIATLTASTAIKKQAHINQILDDRIRAAVKGWGVGIKQTGITDINLSHKLATAMRDRASATFEGETTVIQATAKAEATRLQGVADGDADRSRAAGEILGRVDGMEAMVNRLKVTGDTAVAEGATRGVLKDADTIIIGAEGGMRDILGSVRAAASTFKGVKPKEDK